MRETWLDPPVQRDNPICPVCGEECETVYTDINAEVCGCNNCITGYDAWDYFDDEEDPDADAERGWQCREQ